MKGEKSETEKRVQELLQKSKTKMGIEVWRRGVRQGETKQSLRTDWLWLMKWKEESKMMSQGNAN